MSGLPSSSVSEARGFVATSADVDQLAVVLGCSSLGSGLSSFYLSGQAAVAGVGYGDAPDTLAQIVEQVQPDGKTKKFPAAMYTMPGSTVGVYGAIDVTGVTGTAVASVHSATHPYGTFEAYLRVITGGFIGTDGITLVDSLNNGRDVSNITGLGTATSYTIPHSNVRFDFSPATADLTALHTLVNEIYTDFNAHVVLTTGGVHGISDAADVVSIASATDTATTVARINAIRAAYILHINKTAGGVHGAADTTHVLVAPVATDDSSALILALDIKAKYNLHIATTAGGVHGLADGTNATTSAAPTAGALAAGDIIKVRTKAPEPSTSDIDTAFAALKVASVNFTLLICDFPVTATVALHISTGLALLRTAGKRVTAICRTRIPDFEAAETEAAWATSIAADFATFFDSSILVRAAYGFITDAMTSREYLRSNLAQFAADVVRVTRDVVPDLPADRRMANFRLVDGTGARIGHDEGPRGSVTGLSNDTLGNRFSCDFRLADTTRQEEVFCTIPWVMYASDERIRNLAVRRIANAMERVATSAGNSGLGGRIRYIKENPADPSSVPRLTGPGRRAVHGKIFSALKKEFRKDIANATDASLDTGLVQVDPEITVTGGNLLNIDATLAPSVDGIVLSLALTLAVQE